ncbi:hypothetical protein [Bacillus sp. FJAT-27245]|uniref:hypothetical protein n=1 Tax=Bacillus sp. FJAT-27245 TaxID=1684144 RepID=UPI0006A75894|nr:hypothetical protein [Bacillus sp. FJAT-27245]
MEPIRFTEDLEWVGPGDPEEFYGRSVDVYVIKNKPEITMYLDYNKNLLRAEDENGKDISKNYRII